MAPDPAANREGFREKRRPVFFSTDTLDKL
jgi:hypothetical protein